MKQPAYRLLAIVLIASCLISTGITQAWAVTIGGTSYTHPVEVQNSTVWYNQHGNSRQIGGDAHTYNLVKKYESDQSARNFYAGRGGKIKIKGVALNQNLWRKNKDTSAWQSHATDYSWLVQQGAGSTLNNSVTGKIYLSNNEYDSKNKAFAVVGKIGNSPGGKRYNINSDTFDMENPLLQITPVYQETTGKAGFWLSRNKINVQFQGISESQMKQIPVTIQGNNVPSAQNTGSFTQASQGLVTRTMTYGGKLDGSAIVNPSNAEEQVYNYISCNTDAKNKTLAFSDLSYGNWSTYIKNNSNTDYTLQLQVVAAKGSIYKKDTSGAGDGFNEQKATKTIDFPRGTTLTLPAALMLAGGYINYTLKLTPKAPNSVSMSILGLDEIERSSMNTYLEGTPDGGGKVLERFDANEKTWTGLAAGKYNAWVMSLSTYDYDVKVTADYKTSGSAALKTTEKMYHLDPLTKENGTFDLETPPIDLANGGMINYTIEFLRNNAGRQIGVNINGMEDGDLSETMLGSSVKVGKSSALNGSYSKSSVTPWVSIDAFLSVNLDSLGNYDYWQMEFSAVNASKYYIESVTCMVKDNLTGKVVRSYDTLTYPGGRQLASTTRLPYNINNDSKKLALDGTAQNGIKIEAGQSAIIDMVVRPKAAATGHVKTAFHADSAMQDDNSDGLIVQLCDAAEITDKDPIGSIAVGRLKDGQYDFGYRKTGRKYIVRFLGYDEVGYSVTPAASSPPTVGPLSTSGWTAHFYAHVSPIQLAIEGGAGVTATDKAGIPIDVLTYDGDTQEYTKLTTITIGSNGKVSYQPPRFDGQYYFAPQTTPARCWYPRESVSSARYTGAAQTVTLPLERMQDITVKVTRDDNVSEPISGKLIDVYKGEITNSDAVDNGAEPVLDYKLVDTVRTGSDGTVAYGPDAMKQNLKFVPQGLPKDNLIWAPAFTEVWYTGGAQEVLFNIENKYKPVTVRCTDNTTHASSAGAKATVEQFQPSASGDTYIYTDEEGRQQSIQGRWQAVNTVTLSTTNGKAHEGRFQPEAEGIYRYRITTAFPPAAGYTFALLPSQIIRAYSGPAQTIEFQLSDTMQAKPFTVEFRDTAGQAVTGVSGVLVHQDTGKRIPIETDQNGSCAVYGVSEGNYVFRPYTVPPRSYPVHVQSRYHNDAVADDVIQHDMDIDSYGDYVLEVSGIGIGLVQGYRQIVTYTLDYSKQADADLELQFRLPNSDYIEGDEVVSTFILLNNSPNNYNPDSTALTVRASFAYGGIRMEAGTQTDVIVPAYGSQIVYFKWRVPAGAAAASCAVTGTVTVNDGSPVTGGKDSVTQEVEVSTRRVYETPDTKFDVKSGKYFSPSQPTDKEYHNVTSWEEWAWENGNYVRKQYDARLATTELTLYPDETNPSSQYDPLKKEYTMRSGYAVKLRYRTSPTTSGPKQAVTPVQGALAFFPEFHYNAAERQMRTLELTEQNRFAFRVNPHSTYKAGEKGGGRKHFTPMWYPDKPYQVQTLATDYWTPVGMLSYLDETNKIQISGSLYDDYYVSSGDSGIGGVEIQPGS